MTRATGVRTGLVVATAALCLTAGSAAAGHRAVATSACRSRVLNGVLPVWARAGFSDPKPRMPHVLGAHGNIVAILWADPLLSPPPKDHSNKILWVARVTNAPVSHLAIKAQRMVGARAVGAPVERLLAGGPGPSIVNLPAPGCWRLALRWTGHRADTLDLHVASDR